MSRKKVPAVPTELPRHGRSIMHVDMDAFFASVELLRRPELANRPVIVGGNAARGVVASCNYLARAHGVRSAMSSVEAKRRCPNAVFLAGSYHDYERVSQEMHQVFARFTPYVEGLALDEAFLDISGSRRLFGTPPSIGTAIRTAISEEMNLWASVGAGSTKIVAKLASEKAKPRISGTSVRPGKGVVCIDLDDEVEFLHSHPVRSLWGVGSKTAEKLERIGLNTIGQLAHCQLGALAVELGANSAAALMDLAWNRDQRQVEYEREAKSVGHEQTYATDITESAELHKQLLRLCDAVAERLRFGELAGRTVTLKVRYGDFRTITRSSTVDRGLWSGPHLRDSVEKCLSDVDLRRGVRLLGVSVSSLEARGGGGEQLQFDDGSRDVLETAIGAIRDKFGVDSMVPALLVRKVSSSAARPTADLLRQGQRQWGPTETDPAHSSVPRDDE